MTRNAEAIRRLFRIPHNRSFDFEPFDAVFPGRTAPVIRQLADGDRELSMMSWGFVLLQDGRAPKRVNNTRDDKARTSTVLAKLLRNTALPSAGELVSSRCPSVTGILSADARRLDAYSPDGSNFPAQHRMTVGAERNVSPRGRTW
jgi:hypothetical protein